MQQYQYTCGTYLWFSSKQQQERRQQQQQQRQQQQQQQQIAAATAVVAVEVPKTRLTHRPKRMLPLLYSRNKRATGLPHSTQTKDSSAGACCSAKLAPPFMDTVLVLVLAMGLHCFCNAASGICPGVPSALQYSPAAGTSGQMRQMMATGSSHVLSGVTISGSFSARNHRNSPRIRQACTTQQQCPACLVLVRQLRFRQHLHRPRQEL